MQWLSIVLLSILGCVTYGVIHDQITVHICLEYFTMGHPPVFPTENPTLLGLGWGIIATWWVGAILGVPLAIAARAGKRRRYSARELVRPLAIALGCNAMLATVAGIIGFIAASMGWVRLVGPSAAKLAIERHVPFLVDLWIHSASYLGGAVFGIGLIVWVWRSRDSYCREKSKRYDIFLSTDFHF